MCSLIELSRITLVAAIPSAERQRNGMIARDSNGQGSILNGKSKSSWKNLPSCRQCVVFLPSVWNLKMQSKYTYARELCTCGCAILEKSNYMLLRLHPNLHGNRFSGAGNILSLYVRREYNQPSVTFHRTAPTPSPIEQLASYLSISNVFYFDALYIFSQCFRASAGSAIDPLPSHGGNWTFPSHPTLLLNFVNQCRKEICVFAWGLKHQKTLKATRT